MAEIKLPTVSYKEIGEKGARYALDEVEYKGLTIRQWADKITGGEYAPVVHGKWLKPEYEYHVGICSLCGCVPLKPAFRSTPYNYCPNCGAKMDEEEHNNV